MVFHLCDVFLYFNLKNFEELYIYVWKGWIYVKYKQINVNNSD